ncbi:hypothetical protein LA080_004273 [Diaporthe eres]|nr:hypothetical protein LA080_004273 [Diaporthe eres]
MSAATNMDPDKQTSVQFHHYFKLPAELRIKIIQEFITDLRQQLRLPKFAPFTVIHSEWQHEFEAEQELFGSLCLSTEDLPAYLGMVNQHRGDSLSKLTLRVYINNTAIEFSRHMYHISGTTGVCSRASSFIVNSMVTILDSVVYSVPTGSQATRAGLELHTQIMIPGDEGHRDLRTVLSLPDGICCDFSQLHPLHTIRSFSQERLLASQQRALGIGMMLFLNPSSLLTFVRCMPDLEQAVVDMSNWQSLRGISAREINSCPRLKKLRMTNFSQYVPWQTLAMWISCWGHGIENLETCYTDVPDFLRTFTKRDEHSESITWPNLQVLKVGGYCRALQTSTSADAFMDSGDPTETLNAMAVALAWLPSIRDMTVELGMVDRANFLWIVFKLHLGSGSSNLTMSQSSWQESGRALSHVPWNDSSEPGDLFFRDRMQDAAAEVQDAVRMHRGHDLEITWPETVEKPQSR